MKKITVKTVHHDKEHDIVAIKWWKPNEKHIGSTEEINLLGVTILVDRNEKGKVRALEIM